MGPMLFVIFVVLAVFVVLNMLIAIISDAYAESQDWMRKKKPVNLVKEVKQYIYVHWCWPIKCCVDYRNKGRAKKQAKRAETVAKITAQQNEEKGLNADGTAILGDAEAMWADEDLLDDEDDEDMGREKDPGSQANSLLIEWFDQLKANEAEFERMQTEISSTKKDVLSMKDHFNSGMEKMMVALEEACKATTVEEAQVLGGGDEQQLAAASSPEVQDAPLL